MKKPIYILTILLTFSLINVNAQTLDVNFTGNTGNCGAYTGLTETETLAQSFTAGLSGNLKRVKVGLSTQSCTETTVMNCVAKIYSGDCNGILLTTENFTIPTGASLSMYQINFSSPASITAGQVYTLELSVPSGQNCYNDPFLGGMQPVFGQWHMENAYYCGGEYPGGTAFDPSCVAYPGDYYIQTYVSQCGSNITDVDFTGNTGTCCSYIGLSETQTLAQSFTAGLSGNLTSVKAGLSTQSCTETNVMNCVAKIYSGVCNGTLLTTQNFTIPTGASLSMYQINFSSPASITAGQVYTLELSVPSGQNCRNDPDKGDMQPVYGQWHLENATNCGGEYAGGTAFLPCCVAYSGDYYIQTTVSTIATGIDTRTECSPYAWIDGNIYTSSNNSATHLIVSGASNGCDSLVTLNLTINNVSDLTTTISGTTITANNSNATYQWLDCNNGNSIIVNETGQSFTPSSNSNYAVELTENGCIDTTSCVSITFTGIIENDFGVGLVVFPNPTKSDFIVDLGAVYENIQITITDIAGKLIDSKIIFQTQTLNLSIKEPDGVYFISVQVGDKKAVIRMIKK